MHWLSLPSIAPDQAYSDIDIIEPEIEGSYWGNVFKELKHSWLSMLLPVLILGGIYGVLGPLKFTVTEAAAVAVVYALLVELVLHRFTEPDKSKLMQPSHLPNVLAKSGVMMGSLFRSLSWPLPSTSSCLHK